jgi:hypothetical protein
LGRDFTQETSPPFSFTWPNTHTHTHLSSWDLIKIWALIDEIEFKLCNWEHSTILLLVLSILYHHPSNSSLKVRKLWTLEWKLGILSQVVRFWWIMCSFERLVLLELKSFLELLVLQYGWSSCMIFKSYET